MTPVYMSPNWKQVELIQAALLEQGIASSIISKKPTDGMHELWLKNQADRPRAKVIITQQEFQMLRRDMKNAPVKDNRATQPVDVAALRAEMAEMETAALGRPQSSQRTPRKDYFIPKNLIHVFQRLGSMLGIAEPDMDLDKFYNIQKPWDGDNLKKSVDDLKRITRPEVGAHKE